MYTYVYVNLMHRASIWDSLYASANLEVTRAHMGNQIVHSNVE